MTKIVYNSDYGGFKLSPEGVSRYAKLKGLTIRAEGKEGSLFMRYFIETPVGEEPFYPQDIARTDPALVQTVEELGAKASGTYASLAIAELPSGTLYRIDEYDGLETVMTQDNYEWSIA